MLSILQPEAIPFDKEELYNAAHARLLQLGHWQDWLNLQYRGHCGGCTQHAILGAGLFKVFGHSLFVWKLIPVLYSGLMAYAGARLLRRHVGLAAAAAWGLLLCFPSPAFLELSMTAWGNHYESGVAAIVWLWVALRCRESPSIVRALAVGLVLSWALWIGFSAVFLVLALIPVLWGKVRLRHILALGIGSTPVLLLWYHQHTSALSSPFETIYYAGETAPHLSRIPEKLWSLIAPRQIIALFGDVATGPWAWAAAATIAWAFVLVRQEPSARAVMWTVAAFLAVYCTVRFTVWTPPAPEVAPPGSMRYAAPIYGLLWLILAAAAGVAWRTKRWWLACGLLAPSMVIGVGARFAHYTPPFPDKTVFNMAAADFDYARDQAGYTLSLATHSASTATAPDAIAFHAFGVGWHEARSALDRDGEASLPVPTIPHRGALEGLAAALLSEIDGDETADVSVLVEMDHRLSQLPDGSRIRALAAAAARRQWTRPYREGHTMDGIYRFRDLVSTLPDTVAEALTEDLGRTWASDQIRWRTPKTVNLPDVSLIAHSEAFIRGFAETAGRRIGDVDSPVPPGFETHPEAWKAGLRQGHSQQWINRSR